MALIFPLSEAAQADVSAVGGKAQGLGKLAAGGFTVPAATCIGSELYQLFMDQTGLHDLILGMESRLDGASPKEARQISSELSERLLEAEIPADLTEAIVECHRGLLRGQTATPVAVRSSPAVSLPGQYHTVLNVLGEDALLSAVKEVWASYWTPGAIVARGALGIAHLPVRLGVVIQEMIQPEVAGILFTAEQPSGDTNRVVIEAVTGLGESLALGQRQPDRFVVEKAGLRLIETVAAGRAGKDAEGAGVTTLREDQVAALCGLGIAVEDSFGRPVDMEWAYREGTFYALQARPIRGLEADDVIEPSREGIAYRPQPAPPDTVWTRYWGDNFLRSTFTPGGYAYVIWWCEALENAVDVGLGYRDVTEMQMFKYHRARAYMNTDYLKARARYEPRFLRTQELLNHFPPSQRDEIAALPFKFWSRLLGEVRLLLHPNQTVFRNHSYFQRKSAEILRQVKSKLDVIDLAGSLEDVRKYRRILRKLVARHELGYVGWIFHYKASLDVLLSRMLESWYGESHQEVFSNLVSGVPDNVSVQIASDMWTLSRVVTKEPALAEAFRSSGTTSLWDEVQRLPSAHPFREALDSFLRKYGDRRESQEVYRAPSWAEDPRQVLSVLKAMVGLPDERSPASDLTAQIGRREQTTAKVAKALSSQRWGWFKTRIFREVLKYNLLYAACRENQRFVADSLISRYRNLLLAFGDHLVLRDLLAEREDVFFLTEPEVLECLGAVGAEYVKEKVNSRKALFPRYQVLPPMFLRGNKEELPPAPAAALRDAGGALVLEGTAASPGIITGPVRILRDLSGVDTLAEGDILVASAIDPGWTAAFPIISAVVTEIGGALSHGAIMAREFGLPAVIGVEGALSSLQDGQTITVDGHRGQVTVTP